VDAVLIKKITEFLLSPRKSQRGGWADVTQEDVHQLWDIIFRLVELKFQRDADGDLPIEWNLVNRHETYGVPFVPVRYVGADWGQSMSDTLTNLSISVREMQLVLDLKELEDRQKKAKGD